MFPQVVSSETGNPSEVSKVQKPILAASQTAARKIKAFGLKLVGHAYASVAKQLHISRQRAVQLISPSLGSRNAVYIRSERKCEICGIDLSDKGQVHHKSMPGLAGADGLYPVAQEDRKAGEEGAMSEGLYTVCIDDLLGPKARAHGCRCECGRHAETVKERQLPPDKKMLAANDDSEGPLNLTTLWESPTRLGTPHQFVPGGGLVAALIILASSPRAQYGPRAGSSSSILR